MASRWRHYLVFGLGLLLGVAAGAGMLVAAGHWEAAEAARAEDRKISVDAPRATACEEPPLLMAAGALDGQFGPPADPVDKTRYDITAYLAIGDEAAQQGRVRDAEVAFLTACRIAAHLAGDDPPALGDASYRLGRHYLAVAAADPASTARGDQLGRAEAMLRLAMQAYAEPLGMAHEKTRLAAAGMTLAQQAGALAGPLQAAAMPQPPASSPVAVALAAAAPVPPTATLGGPAEQVRPRARRQAAPAREEAAVVQDAPAPAAVIPQEVVEEAAPPELEAP